MAGGKKGKETPGKNAFAQRKYPFMEGKEEKNNSREKPPFGGTWKGLYAVLTNSKEKLSKAQKKHNTRSKKEVRTPAPERGGTRTKSVNRKMSYSPSKKGTTCILRPEKEGKKGKTVSMARGKRREGRQ